MGASAMTVIDRVWTDNGMTFWPPEGWHGLDDRDWPRTFEVWVKFDDEAERLRTQRRKDAVRCTQWVRGDRDKDGRSTIGHRCNTVLPTWRTPVPQQHQAEVHRWWDNAKGWVIEPIDLRDLHLVNARWTYEMLGFPELYDGRPSGWYETLDGGSARDRAYEADALALGERAACYLLIEARASSDEGSPS